MNFTQGISDQYLYPSFRILESPDVLVWFWLTMEIIAAKVPWSTGRNSRIQFGIPLYSS